MIDIEDNGFEGGIGAKVNIGRGAADVLKFAVNGESGMDDGDRVGENGERGLEIKKMDAGRVGDLKSGVAAGKKGGDTAGSGVELGDVAYGGRRQGEEGKRSKGGGKGELDAVVLDAEEADLVGGARRDKVVDGSDKERKVLSEGLDADTGAVEFEDEFLGGGGHGFPPPPILPRGRGRSNTKKALAGARA